MKKVLLVGSHFPPSNLASVHRVRLFEGNLRAFGWDPTVLAVHYEDYMEELDWDLARLIPERARVEWVRAEIPTLGLGSVRFVGDVTLRSFRPLVQRATELVEREGFDFVHAFIPSFYGALVARAVHDRTGVPYGIDYIDPWVEPNRYPIGSKAWLTQRLARQLEPWAVRKASLITGVAEGYYEAVLDRNPHLREAVTADMPYGGDTADHERVREMDVQPWLFEPDGRFRLIYAGALLPQAVEPLDRVFSAIAADREVYGDLELFFVGTGSSPDDTEGFQVRAIAERHGLWGSVVQEHPARIPYLAVLAHLEAASGVFIQGSTEAHYTPSKVYQGVLSEKPILAVLHQESQACNVLRSTGAGVVLAFDGPDGVDTIRSSFTEVFREYQAFAKSFDPSAVDHAAFGEYSAESVTRILAEAFDEAIGTRSE